jgi:tetratricopeptide (TPR) repeat protein
MFGRGREKKAEELYQTGYACYLKYGKDTIENNNPDLNDIDLAIVYLEQAIDHNPQLAKAMVMLGFAYSAKGDHTNELLYYKKALQYKEQLGNQAAEIQKMAEELEKGS